MASWRHDLQHIVCHLLQRASRGSHNHLAQLALGLQGLLPLYLSPQTGKFTTNKVALGAMGDSYYEYLLKVQPAVLMSAWCTMLNAKYLVMSQSIFRQQSALHLKVCWRRCGC